jgi:hypothetical protein
MYGIASVTNHLVKNTGVRFRPAIKTGPRSKGSSLYTNVPLMLMKDLDFKEIANGKISSRFKQVAVLVGIILIGIVVSILVNG